MLNLMNDELYELGKTYNLITKYNIAYDRRAMLDYVCALHIFDLINNGDLFDYSDSGSMIKYNKLVAIFHNLVVVNDITSSDNDPQAITNSN